MVYNYYTPPHENGGVLWYYVGQWILSKLGIFIDIVEIWFGIVHGQSSSIFDKVI